MQDINIIIEETRNVIVSGTTAIHVSGDDYTQIDEFVTDLAYALGFTVKDEDGKHGEKKPSVVEWNYGYGQVDFKTGAQISGGNGDKMPLAEFLGVYKDPDYARKKIILVRNARHVLEGENNRENLARLQRTILHLRKCLPALAVLVYCDERRFIPDELASLVYFVELKPPSKDELREEVNRFIETKKLELEDAAREKLASRCVGMSMDTFRQVLNKAALKKEDFAVRIIPTADKTKKQSVDKSGLLKYVSVDTTQSDVGGLGHLKWWLGEKKNAFFDPDKAKENGVVPAKGILLAGMPGCGKSLSAKAIANDFGLPLLALDLGSLMGKYLGESEENLRRALKLAENSSPCVLWVDEIEKAFAGLAGDESGVSQRLFGYLLTWLNDKTARVFVVAMANDVAVLPPEFLRRGRFYEIFYVDFPSAPEREAIFTIHLKKAMKKDPDFDLKSLCKETDGYAGSDITALVNAAVETAWNNKRDLILDDLLTQRKYLTPLKEVLAEKIAKNKEKFGQYKLVSASESADNLQRYETDSEGSEAKQESIAKDERCPGHILQKLAKKGSPAIKKALLDNPRCGFDLVGALLHDESAEVKAKAEEKFGKTEQNLMNFAITGAKEDKLSIVKNIMSISMDKRENLLHILAKDNDAEVRLSLLDYKYITLSMWETLASTGDEAYQKKILGHPKCPAEVKAKFER